MKVTWIPNLFVFVNFKSLRYQLSGAKSTIRQYDISLTTLCILQKHYCELVVLRYKFVQEECYENAKISCKSLLRFCFESDHFMISFICQNWTAWICVTLRNWESLSNPTLRPKKAIKWKWKWFWSHPCFDRGWVICLKCNSVLKIGSVE